MKRYSRLLVAIQVFLIFAILTLSGSCNLTLAREDNLRIDVKGASFTIAWDDDSLKISHNINKAVKYKIYCRPHETSFWQPLGEIEAVLRPEFTIDDSLLDYGKYDFGVSAVNEAGIESAIHSSLDRTAEPFCGWYVNWICSK